MKKYIILTLTLIFIGILFCGCGKKQETPSDLDIIKQRGYLIVGVKTDSPPFGYYNKKKVLVGVDIEIANEIANYIFNNDSPGNIKYVSVTPQNRIYKLNSKEVDILVSTMSINEKRKLIMNFSVPYFAANQKIMIKKTSKISGLQYFNKYGKLAVVLGTTGEKTSKFTVPNANIIGAKTYTEAFNLLKTGQVDAILGDDCILQGLNDKNYRIVNRAYSREYYAVATRKTNNSKELLNAVNVTITSILDNKKINLIKKRYLLY